jgi:hypothetical protein
VTVFLEQNFEKIQAIEFL